MTAESKAVSALHVALLLAASLALGGCFASVSVGSGGVSVGAGGGGVTIGAGRGGVSVGAGGRGGSVGVRIGGGGDAPAKRTPIPSGGSSAGLLTKPVADGRLTSGFGMRRGRPHNGIDYAAPRGTAVYAAGDGVVEELRHSASYGNYARIRHADGLETRYAHLAAFAGGLAKGAPVRRGQIIGAVGDTGRASGPHLHYEIVRDGRFVDPLGGR